MSNNKEEGYKSFYTVKEAAKLLGLSTNTIYTYLNQGSLSGRRLNSRGRFKIPFEVLQPFLNAKAEPQAPVVDVYNQTLAYKTQSRLTGVEVILGAAVGVLLVYSFWNLDFTKVDKSSASVYSTTLTKETYQAFVEYPVRTFTKYGDITEGIAINLDRNVFKGNLTAQTGSEKINVLGVKDSKSSSDEIKNPLNQKIILGSILTVLLIVLVGVLVFLTKKSSKKENKNLIVNDKPKNIIETASVDLAKNSDEKIKKRKSLNFVILTIVFLISLMSSVFIFLGSVNTFSFLRFLAVAPKEEKVLASDTFTNNVQSFDTPIKTEEKIYSVKFNVTEGQEIKIFENSSTDSNLVSKIIKNDEVYRIGGQENWIQIETKDATVNGWIDTTSLNKISDTEYSVANVGGEGFDLLEAVSNDLVEHVTIAKTPTGWLRVRNTPSGSEIGKVLPGTSYKVIEKKGKWLLINFEENKTGWISSEYTTK